MVRDRLGIYESLFLLGVILVGLFINFSWWAKVLAVIVVIVFLFCVRFFKRTTRGDVSGRA